MTIKILPYIIASLLILEIYVYQGIKLVSQNERIRWGYLLLTGLTYVTIIIIILLYDKSARNNIHMHLISGIFTIFIVPKILIGAILLLEDIFRFTEFFIRKFTKPSSCTLAERRKFLSISALGLGAILSYSFLDGIIWGKYRHFVRNVKIKIPNLPDSFRGYKILQISDVHCGSFSNPDKLLKAINIINEQNADLVLFTGDMVNSYAEEFEPFVELFSSIKSKNGKFSVLGNHDYGDYGVWKNKEEHKQNISKLIKLQEKAGFKVLRNEYQIIKKNKEKLYLIGVENWGIPPFPQYGDLDKATAGLKENSPKILMSHDPTHFDEIVKNHPSNINLTLSGHTHGMQFGLDLKNIKWSPVQYKYSKWVDLYESEGKYLYVNRGFGVIGYPGRVGIKPEITVFELV